MKNWLIILICAVCTACAPSRLVQPLQKNENLINFSLGGATFTNFGYPLPTPLTSVTYARGLSKRISSFGSFHITSAAYGNAHLEFGMLYGIREYQKYNNKWIPGVSVSGTMNFSSSFRGGLAKLWPQLDANAYWNLFARDDLVYIGVSNLFEIQRERAHGEAQPTQWIFSPQVGYNYRFGRYSANIELKMIAPNKSNENIVVDYLSPIGNKGALGFFLGVSRKF